MRNCKENLELSEDNEVHRQQPIEAATINRYSRGKCKVKFLSMDKYATDDDVAWGMTIVHVYVQAN